MPPLIFVLIIVFPEDCAMPIDVCFGFCKFCGSYVCIIFVIVVVLLHVVFIFT